MTNTLIGICIGLFVFCIFTTIISIVCVAIVVGFKNSTHQIQYMNPWQDEEDEEEVAEPVEEAGSVEKKPLSAEDLKYKEKLEKQKFEREAALAFIGKKED